MAVESGRGAVMGGGVCGNGGARPRDTIAPGEKYASSRPEVLWQWRCWIRGRGRCTAVARC